MKIVRCYCLLSCYDLYVFISFLEQTLPLWWWEREWKRVVSYIAHKIDSFNFAFLSLQHKWRIRGFLMIKYAKAPSLERITLCIIQNNNNMYNSKSIHCIQQYIIYISIGFSFAMGKKETSKMVKIVWMSFENIEILIYVEYAKRLNVKMFCVQAERRKVCSECGLCGFINIIYYIMRFWCHEELFLSSWLRLFDARKIFWPITFFFSTVLFHSFHAIVDSFILLYIFRLLFSIKSFA